MAAVERAGLHLVVDRDVGAAEAVDRLLGIADHEQLAVHRAQPAPLPDVFGVARQVKRELDLDRVGVLELVDQDRPEALAEVVADLGAVADEVARPDDQVVVVGDALGAPLLLVVAHELLDQRQHGEQRLRAHLAGHPSGELLPLGGQLLLPALALLRRGEIGLAADVAVHLGKPGAQAPRCLDRAAAERLELVGVVEHRLDVGVGAALGVAVRAKLLELGAVAVEPAEHFRLGVGHPLEGLERQQVAVAVNLKGCRAQLVGADPEVQRPGDLRAVLGEGPCEPLAEGALEHELGLQVAQRAELGVKAGLDRPLAQQAGGERVDRLDPRAVEAAHRCREACAAPGVGLPAERLLEPLAHPGRELGGRLVREGDHRKLVDGGLARGEHLGDPRDQRRGLARPSAGLDQHVLPDLGADPLARGGIDRCRARAHSTSRIRWIGSNAGSSDLRSMRRMRFVGQRPLAAQ